MLNRPKPQRRSIRLPDYDYSSEGAYFVTICTKNREGLFGEIRNGTVELSKIGQIVRDYWLEIPKHFGNVQLDEFVIMPNHLHGIINITKKNSDFTCRGEVTSPGGGNTGGETPPLQKPVLGKIIAYYKYQTSKLANQLRRTPGIPIWQRNYYEPWPWPEASARAGTSFAANNPWIKSGGTLRTTP